MTVELPRAVTDIDHALTGIEKELELLLHLTPVNAAEAWVDFERSGFATAPTLRSRPLELDLDLVRRRLYDLRLEDVEDPALHTLLNSKRDELARYVNLLADRDTSRFLYGSLALWGEVGETLVKDARELLGMLPHDPPADDHVTATGFAEAAEAELEHYRTAYPGFDSSVEVRTDVSDLMVSHGRMFVPANAVFRAGRVAALVQHEVGTHVITYANGKGQPLALLCVGLPGYDETQEGLAVLAEYAIDGLDPHRLRVLAGRVVAVQLVLDGASFLEVFDQLHTSYGFAPSTAWSIVIRVTRFGGFTKDVIYLRGIARVLEFAEQRKDLSSLLVGKLSLEHVPLIEELCGRGVLQPAWIRPRWFEMEGAQERLERAFEGMGLLDLIRGGAR